MASRFIIRSTDYPNQTPSNIEYKFLNAPNLGSQVYELALVGGKIVNSVPNISVALENNKFRYREGVNPWNEITLPNGTYEASAINNVIQDYFIVNNDYGGDINNPDFPVIFIPNITLNRVQLSIRADVEIDFLTNPLYQAFGALNGFDPNIYSNAGGVNRLTVTAQGIARYTDRGDAYFITVDIIGNNGIYVSESLQSGVVKVVYGEFLGYPISLQDPTGFYLYFPITGVDVLRRMRIQVLDNRLEPADFNGEQTIFEFEIKPMKTYTSSDSAMIVDGKDKRAG